MSRGAVILRQAPRDLGIQQFTASWIPCTRKTRQGMTVKTSYRRVEFDFAVLNLPLGDGLKFLTK
jgi:hypothetical protein